ncbi:MAG: hypothetical protein DCC75_07745 [Proteobacteria bacterium]|nr:MAG: hypothetical protein DCC75_07745 [Pseudomonadota bacterium]
MGSQGRFAPSINWLFVLTPVSLLLADREGISSAVVFFISALAIVPIAHLIVHATEKIAYHTGEAVGGLLNATFGNAPELIICIVALRSGVQTAPVKSGSNPWMIFAVGLFFCIIALTVVGAITFSATGRSRRSCRAR